MWIITIHIRQSKSYKRVREGEMEFTLHDLERLGIEEGGPSKWRGGMMRS